MIIDNYGGKLNPPLGNSAKPVRVVWLEIILINLNNIFISNIIVSFFVGENSVLQFLFYLQFNIYEIICLNLLVVTEKCAQLLIVH
ncbi:hypothetical protein UT300018_19590 [Clostridium faecium]